MGQQTGMDRRAFLRGASLTALAAASGGSVSTTAAASRPTSGQYDFNDVVDRVGTDCYKWDKQIELFGQENIVVPMGIADMDFRTAPVITEALMKKIQEENWGYMHVPPSFKESMIDWNRRRYGEEIDGNLLLTATGVVPAIHSGLRAFAPPGSKVLLQAPVYSSFYGVIDRAGCIAEESPMKIVDGRYQIDFEDLERRIDHDTNVLISAIRKIRRATAGHVRN
ncbi:MAG: aminotransferase class I/II-fold pyridoxal phosphate-dependent enzyme [Woeseiaceae bacterium]|nr:aminotransferase class I/II-fold pyridoxal phosphate-dependent enzyme [Woeseiaceae bacterium]